MLVSELFGIGFVKRSTSKIPMRGILAVIAWANFRVLEGRPHFAVHSLSGIGQTRYVVSFAKVVSLSTRSANQSNADWVWSLSRSTGIPPTSKCV